MKESLRHHVIIMRTLIAAVNSMYLTWGRVRVKGILITLRRVKYFITSIHISEAVNGLTFRLLFILNTLRHGGRLLSLFDAIRVTRHLRLQ